MTNYRFIGAAKGAVAANRDTAKQVVGAGKVVALRALDMQRNAVKSGSAMIAKNGGRYGTQLRQQLAQAQARYDATARRLVNNAAHQAARAVDQMAVIVERGFDRLETALEGRVAEQLDRFALPIARVSLQAAERVNKASGRVLKFAKPQPAKAAARKVRAKARKVRKTATRAARQMQAAA
ncbi:MAG: hypothetical protein N2544_13865 [Burkholderiales bacterium]|nr:hypothetical protein [Burkholderiales bacterium]